MSAPQIGRSSDCRHDMSSSSAHARLSVCLSICCRTACIMMNELPSMAREAPLFKVTALGELLHFGELPSDPSRRTGHTCACTRTHSIPHTVLHVCGHACTDKLPVISDHIYIYRQLCSHTHSRLALLAGAGQPSGLLAG